MNKLEIIENTVEYYNGYNRRAIGGYGECFYEDANGRRCAIGRFVNSDFDKNYLGDIQTYVKTTMKDNSHQDTSVDHFLIESVKGHSIGFWRDLQRFHDMSDLWDIKNGKEVLSERGLIQVNILKNKYK